MAQAIRYPKKTVTRYLNHLGRTIRIDRALLFGSFAYGKPTKHSDVDIAVVSPDFRGQDFWKRISWLSLQRRGIADDIAMDVIGYTPEEYENIGKESLVMRNAQKRGKVIFSSR